MTPLLLPAFRLAAPGGAGARLSILLFHRVHARPDPLFEGEPDAARFDAICRWLARWFRVLPLDEAVTRLAERRLPARAACITFDDGYADNHEQALPVLQRHGLVATFFVATGYLDGGRMFNDTVVESVRRAPGATLRTEGLAEGLPTELPIGDDASRRAAIVRLIDAFKYHDVPERNRLAEALRLRAGNPELPRDLMMHTEQVRALHRAGMQIGAHTVTHPILARLSDDAVRRELDDSRRALAAATGAPVTLFAYPNGRPGDDYDLRTVELVRAAGFAAAVSTAWGCSNAGTDRFQLPRFTPWDRSEARFGLRLLANLRRRPQLLGAVAS
jgi:peptidoglycan/xylan/chitin deacetylase (PgdA/CDA1 family)